MYTHARTHASARLDGGRSHASGATMAPCVHIHMDERRACADTTPPFPVKSLLSLRFPAASRPLGLRERGVNCYLPALPRCTRDLLRGAACVVIGAQEAGRPAARIIHLGGPGAHVPPRADPWECPSSSNFQRTRIPEKGPSALDSLSTDLWAEFCFALSFVTTT